MDSATSRSKWTRRALRWGPALLGALLAVAVVPRWWCGRRAEALIRGEAPAQLALARGVDDWTGAALSEADFHTGSDRFSGEWWFGTLMMGGLGFGQVALQQPAHRTELLAAMERAIDGMLARPVRDFDTVAWGEDALDSLSAGADHGAFLGYANLVLSLHRLLDADSRFGPLNDQISRALTERIAASPLGLVQTYPGEVYPIDNCAGVASVLLHARATGAAAPPVVEGWADEVLATHTDPASGLLVQSVSARDGRAIDGPRASGTAMCAYFLSFADVETSRSLYAAASAGEGRLLGFGAVREYPRGVFGLGDIDSGPVVLGYGVSVTGMTLGSSRVHGDDDQFRRLYRTAFLFGAPVGGSEGVHWAAGGPIGDALMFAFLTAVPGGAGR